MDSGKANDQGGSSASPIVGAIAEAEHGTTGEVRVHLSRRLREPDPLGRALKLFAAFGMARTARRNAVLLYINLRRRKVAVVGDLALHEAVGQRYWERLLRDLATDLRATHPENAIAIAVMKIGAKLKEHFPDEGPAL